MEEFVGSLQVFDAFAIQIYIKCTNMPGCDLLQSGFKPGVINAIQPLIEMLHIGIVIINILPISQNPLAGNELVQHIDLGFVMQPVVNSSEM